VSRDRQTRVICVNVKHFKGAKARVDRLVDYLQITDADVIGVLEVTGSKVYPALAARMRSHTWVQSDHPADTFKGGRESQKILIGVRKTHGSFVSVLSQFRTYNPYLRPGVFVTVDTPADQQLNFLFIHNKSGGTADGLGTRQKQFNSLLKLAKKVPNFVVLGDYNTMGMDYPYVPDVEGHHELRWLDGRLKSRKMHRLSKTVAWTWNPNPYKSTYPRSDLDHVIASKSLDFSTFKGGAMVRVDGPDEHSTKEDIQAYREHFSDHSALYMEINA